MQHVCYKMKLHFFVWLNNRCWLQMQQEHDLLVLQHIFYPGRNACNA